MADDQVVQISKLPVIEKDLVQEWETRTVGCVEYFKNITKVTNKVELKDAEEAVGGASELFKEIQDQRLEFTRQLDAVKAELMVYEKRVDPDKKSGTEVARVKKLIDNYYQEEIARINKEKKEAQLKKDKAVEASNIKNDFPTTVVKKLNVLISDLDTWFEKWSKKLTLENWDDQIIYLDKKVKMPTKTYEEFFAIPYQFLTSKEYQDLMEELKNKEEFGFEVINDRYAKMVDKSREGFKKLMPGIKKNLLALAKANEDEAAKILEQQEQAVKDQQEKAAQEREDNISQFEAQQEINKNSEQLTAQFEHQKVAQETIPKGTRTTKVGRILATSEEIPATVSRILFHVFDSNEFPGIYKLTKDNQLEMDEYGNPILIDPVKYFLDFYIKNCYDENDKTTHVKGVIVEEKYTVVKRKNG